jgi:hypothetical protein
MSKAIGGDGELPAKEPSAVSGLRKHAVNLERVQRIHLGLDAEAMEFSEKTVSDMIQEIAEHCDEHEAFKLHALVRALRGQDEHHQLVLKQKKPGKWVSPTESDAKFTRRLNWLWTLGNFEREGIKTEAAVARIAELDDTSRAAVFAGVKEAEQHLDFAWAIFHPEGFQGPRPRHLTNPRPAKKADA